MCMPSDPLCNHGVVQIRNKVGEHLYVAIAGTYPQMAGKLTGMFLEAAEVGILLSLPKVLRSCRSLNLSVHSPVSNFPFRRPSCTFLTRPYTLQRFIHEQNLEDLSLLLFSPASLQLHLEQAVAVLESVNTAPASGAASPADKPAGPSPSRATKSSKVEEASGAKRVHPRETGVPSAYTSKTCVAFTRSEQ